MDIALTTLLVASKAEETSQRIRHLLSAAYLVLNPDHVEEVKIGEEHRVRVTQYEHLVLEAMEYNFVVRHAHEVLLRLLKEFGVREGRGKDAFEFCRRCYLTPVVLCYPPEFIAAASLYQSRKFDEKETETIEKLIGSDFKELKRIVEFIERRSVVNKG
jgi:hypothetical protein